MPVFYHVRVASNIFMINMYYTVSKLMPFINEGTLLSTADWPSFDI